jgi:hypothetical protein
MRRADVAHGTDRCTLPNTASSSHFFQRGPGISPPLQCSLGGARLGAGEIAVKRLSQVPRILSVVGYMTSALDAYDRAIGLAEDPAARGFLLIKRG